MEFRRIDLVGVDGGSDPVDRTSISSNEREDERPGSRDVLTARNEGMKIVPTIAAVAAAAAAAVSAVQAAEAPNAIDERLRSIERAVIVLTCRVSPADCEVRMP